MLEKMLDYERTPFIWLNGSGSILVDHFMWLVSDKLVWTPWLLCLLWILLYKKNWKETLLIILSIIIVITICDQIASGLFKPFFQRVRPTHHPDFMEGVKTVFNYRGGRYGFASSHASNSFGVAMFTALLFRNKVFTLTIFFFALLNGYSRIYLGVHFISDIVVGAMIGIVMGIFCYKLYLLARRLVLKVPASDLTQSLYSSKEVYVLSSVFWGTLIILLVFNNQLVIWLK